jgi:ribosomal protein L2
MHMYTTGDQVTILKGRNAGEYVEIVNVEDEFVHVRLASGRISRIPLSWIQ